jgi:hypothetical protein
MPAEIVTLIVTLCAGTLCEVHTLALPGASLMTCMAAGQAEIAKNFPPRGDQKVTRWRCQMEK